MRKPIHSSLGHLTPIGFEQRWLAHQEPVVAVH